MAKGIISKAARVGRATIFSVGIAAILAVVLGVATTATAADGSSFLLGKSNVAKQVSTLINKGAGAALGLKVEPRQAPLTVNPEAGTATNLSADELDGKDSDQILPIVRAEKDPSPFNADTVTGMSAETNSVSIDAPVDGILVISGNVWLYNPSNEVQSFSTRIRLDGSEEAHLDASNVPANRSSGLSPNVTLPVDAGQHTVTLDAVRAGGSSNWSYTSNNLTVTFYPAGRGQVTDAGS
jgi:hypothetical protein